MRKPGIPYQAANFVSIFLFVCLILWPESRAHAQDSNYHLMVNLELGCKIEFPGKPDESTQASPTASGTQDLHLFMYNGASSPGDPNLLYMLACTVYTDTNINSSKPARMAGLYRNAIDGAAHRIGGKIISEQEINTGTHTGREARLQFQDGNAIVTLRIFLIKNRFYLTQTITNSSNDGNAATQRFLDSFSLLKS